MLLERLKILIELNNYKGNDFVNNNQTLGAIYIVRDPRNVITSMKNHYSMSYEYAYSKLIDDYRLLFNYK